MKLFYGPTFEADAGDKGGVDEDLIAKLVGDKTIDLTTKFKVGDTEMTVADLVKSAKESADIKETAIKLAAWRDDMLDLGDEKLAPAKREEILTTYYKDMGMDHTEAAAAAKNAIIPAENVDDDDTDDDDADKDTDVIDAKIAALEAKQVGMDAREAEANRTNARKAIEKSVNDALDSDPDMKVLLDVVGNRSEADKKDEAVSAAKAVFQGQIQQRTKELIQKDFNASGKFEVERFPELAVKAAQEVVEQQRAVIGDFAQLGKSAETVPPEVQVLRDKEPVKMPTPEDISGKGVGDAKKDIEAWLTDEEARENLAAAEAGGLIAT